MKTQLMIIVFLLIAISCASQKKEIILKSTIKLEGKDTNIRDLIDIDGYYQNMDYSKIMLFEDGLYVDQFFFKQGLSESEIQANIVCCCHYFVFVKNNANNKINK